MNKSTKILIALLVVVVIAGVIAFFISMNKQEPTDNNTNNADTSEQNNGQTPATPEEPAAPATATITYDGNGFSLSSNTIKAGETVTVVNDSDKDLNFNSDPHPAHTDNPELNAGPIAPGESRSFVIETKGTWGFHNHLNASQNGSLTVE